WRVRRSRRPSRRRCRPRHRTAVTAGRAGYAAVLVLGAAAGVLAAVAARLVSGPPGRPFVDDWHVMPAPSALPPAALGAAAAAALCVLGLSWWLAALPLARQLTGTGTASDSNGRVAR
ncbi:hypothetical protein AB0K00_57330, partial [Dactylosporangium sp. NPDC049525]